MSKKEKSMGNSNGKITAPVGLQPDMYGVQGLVKTGTFYDVAEACRNAHGRINKWSLKKPVEWGTVADMTEADYKNAHYGLSVPDLPALTTSDRQHTHAVWEYVPPTKVFRMTDFDGYNHSAIPPVFLNFPTSISRLNGNFVMAGLLYMGLDEMGQMGFDPQSMVKYRDFADGATLDSYFAIAITGIVDNSLRGYYISDNRTIRSYIEAKDYGYISLPNFSIRYVSWLKPGMSVTMRMFLSGTDISSGVVVAPTSMPMHSLEYEWSADRRTYTLQQGTLADKMEVTITFTIERISTTTCRFAKVSVTIRRTDTTLGDRLPFSFSGGSRDNASEGARCSDTAYFTTSSTWTKTYTTSDLADNLFSCTIGREDIFYLSMFSDNQVIGYKEQSVTLN